MKLDDDFLRRGQLRYDVFPDRPLGQFRVEVVGRRFIRQTESAHSTRLIVTRLRRPRHWNEDAPDSPFGIHMGSTTRHQMLAKAIGINWTRLHDAGCAYTCWAFVEPHKGQWAFHDDDIARYREHHIEILGMLGTAPPWATGVPAKPNGPEYWDRWLEPKDDADYANYVRVMRRDTRIRFAVGTCGMSRGANSGRSGMQRRPNRFDPPPLPRISHSFRRLRFDAAKKVDPTLTSPASTRWAAAWARGGPSRWSIWERFRPATSTTITFTTPK